jgi:hypothetical protein
MHHFRDDVFAGPAFAVDQYRNVRRSDFVESASQCLHRLRLPKYHGLGWNVAD